MSSFENSFEKYKQIFRNIEKLAKKCVNLKGSIKFNRTCLNNGLYLKFVQIHFIICNLRLGSRWDFFFFFFYSYNVRVVPLE